MYLIFHTLYESSLFAIKALRSNALRALLTLLGVTIGIFSIISVFTAIDYLEKRIGDSIKSLGDNVVYVQKWPWAPPEGESEYPWWRYLNRPQPLLEEAEFIRKKSKVAESVAFIMATNQKVIHYDVSYDNATIMGVEHDFEKIWSFSIAEGRYFSFSESIGGAKVALIGAELAEELFRNESAVGRNVKVNGVRYQIVGQFTRSGDDMFGNSLDKNLVIPVMQARSVYNLRSEANGPTIMIKSKPEFSTDDLADELTGLTRSYRRLKPLEENNFALNRISLVQKNFDSLFVIIDFAGWFIGGFSILVGAFGIANIMFVSVRERTRIIGIQKALGARKLFILSQFLFEGVLLALLGGAIGLILVFFITLWMRYTSDIPFVLTLGNILMGISISAITGIVAGFIPALKAANMNPVNAINQV